MNEQQLKEAFMQYLQQKSGAQTQQEFEAYVQQLGEEGLQQEYMQFMQLLQQQQVASRKFGGMLNYIEKLRGICPEGYEMQFFKQGGQICKKCVQKARMQNGGDFPEDNPVEAFKKKHQLKAQMDRFKQPKDKKINWPKNVKSNTPTLPPYEKTDSPIPLPKDSNNIKPVKKDKCGSKMKKKACGGPVKKDQEGGTVKAIRTVTTYPNKLENQQRVVQYFDDGTQAVINGGWGTDGRFRATLRGRRGEFGNTAGTPRQQQIADSLKRVDWGQLGWGPIQVPALKKTSRTK